MGLVDQGALIGNLDLEENEIDPLFLQLSLGHSLPSSGQVRLWAAFCCCHFLELDPQFGAHLEKGP